MREQLNKVLVALILLICCFTINANAGNFLKFKIQDNNVEGIEKQSLITAAALSADYDGEGVNNDVALIDQSRGVVYLLLFNKNFPTARLLATIDFNNMFNTRLLPTSATAFLDAKTGRQNIAITAVSADGTGNGKLIVGVNDGSGQFGFKEQFQIFDISRGATDINHGDFNLDGFDDLAYIDFREDRAAILLNDGANRFTLQSAAMVGNVQPVSAIVGDFNDDDYLDLVVLSRISNFSLTEKGQINSAVTTLFGNGQGQLIKGTDTQVPSFGISMVGGLVDPINRPIAVFGSRPARQNYDLDTDGLPDLSVLSTGFGQTSPVITNLLNNRKSPGNFVASQQASLALSSSLFEQGQLTEAAEDGGAEQVSGAGIGDIPLGIGGAYHALGVGDFDGDSSLDLVVAGTIVPKTGANAGINFRAISYIFNLRGGFQRVAFFNIGYGKNSTNATTLEQLDPADGKDSFVATIPGIFANAANLLPGVLQVSLNGNLWIDTNQSELCEYGASVNIDRRNFNAPIGSGRKVIITAGETAEVNVDTSRLDNGKIGVQLGGDFLSFVRIRQLDSNHSTIMIDTSQFMSLPTELRANVGVLVEAFKGPCAGIPEGPFTATGFTLIVRPNSTPNITPIAWRTVEVGKTDTVQLNISDPENQPFTTSVKCDRGNLATINGSTLTLTPTLDDVGMVICTITAKDSFGLSSSGSFGVNVKPITGAPVIEAIQDQGLVVTEVREISVTATDPANQQIKLVLVSAPAFVTFVDNGNGRGSISIAPKLSDTEGGRVVVQAINTAGLVGQQSFNISLTLVPVITNVFINSRRLDINGRNFGPTSTVTVNNKDVTGLITFRGDTQIFLSGKRKKLKLVSGANQIRVIVNGIVSNIFVLNLFGRDVK